MNWIVISQPEHNQPVMDRECHIFEVAGRQEKADLHDPLDRIANFKMFPAVMPLKFANFMQKLCAKLYILTSANQTVVQDTSASLFYFFLGC